MTATNAAPAAGRTIARVQLRWAGAHRFDTGRPGGPVARLDASGETGQSPVDALLSALAACTSVDVVEILEKRRTPVQSLEVETTGTRADSVPRRVNHIAIVYRLRGAGIERMHAERAVELAITKYCSVRDTLDPALPIEWSVELDGEPGETRRA